MHFEASLVVIVALMATARSLSFASTTIAIKRMTPPIRKYSQTPQVYHRTLHARRLFRISRGGAFMSSETEGGNASVPIPPSPQSGIISEYASSASSSSTLNELMPASPNEGSVLHQPQPRPQTPPKLGGPPPGFLRKALPSFPWHRLPDWLTYARCIAIPLMGVLFYYPTKQGVYRDVTTATVFAFASITDFLDGYLARRWKISSSFGAFLDPGECEEKEIAWSTINLVFHS